MSASAVDQQALSYPAWGQEKIIPSTTTEKVVLTLAVLVIITGIYTGVQGSSSFVHASLLIGGAVIGAPALISLVMKTNQVIIRLNGYVDQNAQLTQEKNRLEVEARQAVPFVNLERNYSVLQADCTRLTLQNAQLQKTVREHAARYANEQQAGLAQIDQGQNDSRLQEECARLTLENTQLQMTVREHAARYANEQQAGLAQIDQGQNDSHPQPEEECKRLAWLNTELQTTALEYASRYQEAMQKYSELQNVNGEFLLQNTQLQIERDRFDSQLANLQPTCLRLQNKNRALGEGNETMQGVIRSHELERKNLLQTSESIQKVLESLDTIRAQLGLALKVQERTHDFLAERLASLSGQSGEIQQGIQNLAPKPESQKRRLSVSTTTKPTSTSAIKASAASGPKHRLSMSMPAPVFDLSQLVVYVQKSGKFQQEIESLREGITEQKESVKMRLEEYAQVHANLQRLVTQLIAEISRPLPPLPLPRLQNRPLPQFGDEVMASPIRKGPDRPNPYNTPARHRRGTSGIILSSLSSPSTASSLMAMSPVRRAPYVPNPHMTPIRQSSGPTELEDPNSQNE